MSLENIKYVPTLAIRPSEMNGLEQLPGLTKDRMRPLILLAPWTNANSLEKAVDRIHKAYPDRRYFLELDRDYSISNLEAEAQREFLELLSPENCFGNWRDFVFRFPNAIPCLQLQDQSREHIQAQIELTQQEGRDFCLRIVLARFPPNLEDVVGVLNEIGTADYTVVLEGGWIENALDLAARMSGLVSGPLGDLDADIPIVISCTSMPNDFQDFRGCSAIPFTNRELVEQIARSNNRRRIFYGDWGSTRPREASGFRQRPLDRIDYPVRREWIIARNRDEGWSFRDAAMEVVQRSGYWEDGLNVWGSNMILQTIVNPAFGINTPPKNVASRVNIHLHRQAFYDVDTSDLDFDDEWQD
ncbi:MAG: hypothetical protein F4204_08510 [Rhodospirillaceae bacterium]|nr:hypothetical protein [Rhodospirillaceae bacterium]